MDEIYKPETLAERLKELRMEKGINGKQEPSASAIFKLANFFEVSADYLIGLKDYK